MDFNKLTTEQINKSVITDRLKMVAVVTICGIMLFACSNSSNKASVANSKASEIALIKSRWEKAFQVSSFDSKKSFEGLPDNANLNIYFTDPELSVLKSYNRQLAESNGHLVGSVNYRNNLIIELNSRTKAQVVACGVDSAWIENNRTHSAIMGTAPGSLPVSNKSTLLFINKTWKISSETINEGKKVC
jgi:hypothetical protein